MRKFQVVCMDKQGYINEFTDFTYNQIDPMLRYINKKCTEDKNNKIEIVRWNEKGERE